MLLDKEERGKNVTREKKRQEKKYVTLFVNNVHMYLDILKFLL